MGTIDLIRYVTNLVRHSGEQEMEFKILDLATNSFLDVEINVNYPHNTIYIVPKESEFPK